jgi:hypothetical protein
MTKQETLEKITSKVIAINNVYKEYTIPTGEICVGGRGDSTKNPRQYAEIKVANENETPFAFTVNGWPHIRAGDRVHVYVNRRDVPNPKVHIIEVLDRENNVVSQYDQSSRWDDDSVDFN